MGRQVHAAKSPSRQPPRKGDSGTGPEHPLQTKRDRSGMQPSVSECRFKETNVVTPSCVPRAWYTSELPFCLRLRGSRAGWFPARGRVWPSAEGHTGSPAAVWVHGLPVGASGPSSGKRTGAVTSERGDTRIQ